MAFSEDQNNHLKLLLQIQAYAYKDSLNRIYSDFKEMKNDYDVKFIEIQRSLEYTQNEFDDLKKLLLRLKKKTET